MSEKKCRKHYGIGTYRGHVACEFTAADCPMCRILALEEALLALRTDYDGMCWCGVGLDDPRLEGKHTRACQMARAAAERALARA